MRFRFIIYVLTGLVVTLSGCEKNFDPKIYGSFTQDKFPKTKQDYINAAMACYMPFSSNWRYNLQNAGSKHPWYIIEGGLVRLFDGTSDLMAPVTTTGLTGDWLNFSKADFNNTIFYGRGSAGANIVNHFQVTGEVTRMTQIVKLLTEAPEAILDAATKERLLAEVRLCRGLHMYYAFHTYGPLPFITEPQEIYDDVALQRMARPTLKESAEKITADFEYAIAHMPEREKVTEKGRYNKDYARYIAMLHYLNEGSYISGYYQKAVDSYKALEGHYSLFKTGTNPYAQLFASQNKFNNEIIMAVSVSPTSNGDSNTGNGNPIGMYMIPSDASTKIGENPELDPHGPGWSQYYNIAVSFYDSFEPNDLRAKSILTSYKAKDGGVRTRAEIGTKWSGFIMNKFKPEVKGTWQPMDIPLARWSDVLLLYAEALTRLNRSVTPEAVDAVDQVRRRAGLVDLSGEKTNGMESFLTAILDERGHELYFEGTRKIDLIRFNVYAQRCKVSKGTVPTHQYMPIPDYAVIQAREYGIQLAQTYARPEWQQDLNSVK